MTERDGLGRRGFLARLAGGVAAATVAPAVALEATERMRSRIPPLWLVGDDEAYWKTVRDQFPMRPGFIYLNAANLAPSPYVVSDTVADLTRESPGSAVPAARRRRSNSSPGTSQVPRTA